MRSGAGEDGALTYQGDPTAAENSPQEATGNARLARVLVVGAGLLGTSIGLALTASGVDVRLDDASRTHLDLAVGRGAGSVWNGRDQVDLAIIAVPPRVTAAVLARLLQLNVARTYTHVASVQSHVQAEVEVSGLDVSCVVGGHPMAGRATSGPLAGTVDLFSGRPWCVCPLSSSTQDAVDDVRALAMAVGAVPVLLSADEHDRAVALVSHLPQIAASALAGLLTDRLALELSGPGLVDTTRIAASDPDLWTDVLTGNAGRVGPLVDDLIRALQDLSAALAAPTSPDRDARVRAFLTRGTAGRALVPVKRGAGSSDFQVVSVRLADRPGELARLLAQASVLHINVEDVDVDHLTGRPDGVVSMTVQAVRAAELSAGLTRAGWMVEPAQNNKKF